LEKEVTSQHVRNVVTVTSVITKVVMNMVSCVHLQFNRICGMHYSGICLNRTSV